VKRKTVDCNCTEAMRWPFDRSSSSRKCGGIITCYVLLLKEFWPYPWQSSRTKINSSLITQEAPPASCRNPLGKPASPEVREKKFRLIRWITIIGKLLNIYVMKNHREHADLVKMGPHVCKQEHEQENPCYLQDKWKQLCYWNQNT